MRGAGVCRCFVLVGVGADTPLLPRRHVRNSRKGLFRRISESRQAVLLHRYADPASLVVELDSIDDTAELLFQVASEIVIQD